MNAATDAEERADDAKNKAEELAAQIDEIDEAASKLTKCAAKASAALPMAVCFMNCYRDLYMALECSYRST